MAPFPYSDFPDPLGFQNDTQRFSTGYQADIQADAQNLVSAGVDLEHESGEIGSRSERPFSPRPAPTSAPTCRTASRLGGFFATAGARVEHNDSFGTKVVPRVALAYRVRGGNDATTLRASAGAGIKEPDFFQSFGISSFALGNPDLKPERSRTFDVGVEQRLFAGRARADVSYFHHEYRDQIAYQYDFATGTGTYVNLGKTRGQGLEVAVAASPLPRLQPVRGVHVPRRRDPGQHQLLRSGVRRGRVAPAAAQALRARSPRATAASASRSGRAWCASASAPTATSSASA